jgi:transposase
MLRPDGTIPRVYLHRAPVDFRMQQRGLAARVEQVIQADPFSGALFAFTNRRYNKLKLLFWERNGFVIWYKSLAEEKFHWPRSAAEEVVTLSAEQLNWLLDGYDVWKMKPHKTLNYSYAS